MAGGSAARTIDHATIQAWVEERGGRPAHVIRTGSGDDPGVLRIDFPGYTGEGTLKAMDWDDWFDAFETNQLAFLHQDTTADGRVSRFSKLVRRRPEDELADERPHERGRRRRAARPQWTSTARTRRNWTRSGASAPPSRSGSWTTAASTAGSGPSTTCAPSTGSTAPRSSCSSGNPECDVARRRSGPHHCIRIASWMPQVTRSKRRAFLVRARRMRGQWIGPAHSERGGRDFADPRAGAVAFEAPCSGSVSGQQPTTGSPGPPPCRRRSSSRSTPWSARARERSIRSTQS